MRQSVVKRQLLSRSVSQANANRYPLQRLATARATLLKPVCLFVDEPVSRLDPITARDIILMLGEFAGKRKYGGLPVSHGPVLVDRVCHRVLRLNSPSHLPQAFTGSFRGHDPVFTLHAVPTPNLVLVAATAHTDITLELTDTHAGTFDLLGHDTSSRRDGGWPRIGHGHAMHQYNITFISASAEDQPAPARCPPGHCEIR